MPCALIYAVACFRHPLGSLRFPYRVHQTARHTQAERILAKWRWFVSKQFDVRVTSGRSSLSRLAEICSGSGERAKGEGGG